MRDAWTIGRVKLAPARRTCLAISAPFVRACLVFACIKVPQDIGFERAYRSPIRPRRIRLPARGSKFRRSPLCSCAKRKDEAPAICRSITLYPASWLYVIQPRVSRVCTSRRLSPPSVHLSVCARVRVHVRRSEPARVCACMHARSHAIPPSTDTGAYVNARL